MTSAEHALEHSKLRHFARRLDLTSLHLFVAVAVVEAGSIGRAAEREFIAPSAVSKRLPDLEAALDTPLLYRHTGRARLCRPARDNALARRAPERAHQHTSTPAHQHTSTPDATKNIASSADI